MNYVNYLHTSQQKKWNSICVSHIRFTSENLSTQRMISSWIFKEA